MPKRKLEIDVYEAAIKRTEYAFKNFDKVYVSFSGGKDSTVMLHIVGDVAKRLDKRFGIMFIDLEGQYKLTIDHIQSCMEMYKSISDQYWICLPIHLRNAVSQYQHHWVCWDDTAKEAWIRTPPDGAVTDKKYFPFFHEAMEFEEFVPLFGDWYAQGKSCACLVGIRTDESLNRFRTIVSKVKRKHDGVAYTTQVTDLVANVYPVYDWRTEDLWTYHYRNPEKPSNKLYDMMHKAGLTIHQMRICQPYGDDQRKGLWLFHVIEPETWARIVARVNGANHGAMYVQESGNILGYRRISKPKEHTWKTFAGLLIGSMPPGTSEHFKNKIILFERWWMERGYGDGIPDEAPYELEANRKAPSWRRICKALLRNDYWCKGLGFSQHKSAAYEKYLELMRKRRAQWNQD